jgi:endonuclease-3
LELLIATILSAQCTDARVNIVTKTLFKKYRKPQDYLKSKPGQLEDDIRSTGFFNNKAKNIRGACEKILSDYGGEVPRTMDELLTLPGVARKTANVVLGNAFDIAAGVVVDTHIKRLSYRLGWSDSDDPVRIEADLKALLPEDEWIFAGHAVIWHGRRICIARKPLCGECALAELCPKRGVVVPGD